MTHRRPVVALHISTQLFRDALSRALHPHADVVIVPESDTEHAAWLQDQGPLDLAIVSGVARVVDLDAAVVVDVPAADGAGTVGHVRGHGTPVRTLTELLALVGAPR